MSDLNGDLNSIIFNLRSFAELDHFLFVNFSKAMFLPQKMGERLTWKAWIWSTTQMHRSDSIQGTDYIANDYKYWKSKTTNWERH